MSEGIDVTQWFVWFRATPSMLLRRRGFVDEAWRDGAWQPTKAIVDWMFGHDDLVDPISEAEARQLAPAAFG